MGVRSRIWKGRHHVQVLIRKLLRYHIYQYSSFPDNSPKHEYYRSLSYWWALYLPPFFLEKSSISLELAGLLRRRTFTAMAQQIPRRKRLAKEAITKYLLRVEPAEGNSSIVDGCDYRASTIPGVHLIRRHSILEFIRADLASFNNSVVKYGCRWASGTGGGLIRAAVKAFPQDPSDCGSPDPALH